MVGGVDLGSSAYWTHPGVADALGPDGWSGGYDIEVLAVPLSADHTTPRPGFDPSKDIYLEYLTMRAVTDDTIDQDGVEIADVSSCAPEHGGGDTSFARLLRRARHRGSARAERRPGVRSGADQLVRGHRFLRPAYG